MVRRFATLSVLLLGVAAVVASEPTPECNTDEECVAECEGIVEDLSGPAPSSPASFATSACTLEPAAQDDVVVDVPTCRCLDAEGDTAASLPTAQPRAVCLAFGRLGTCLLAATEVGACSTDDPAACDAACALLAARLVDDQRARELSLRSTSCSENCRCVVDVEGTCVRANRDFDGEIIILRDGGEPCDGAPVDEADVDGGVP